MTQPRNSHGLIRSSMEQNISSQSSGDRGVKKMHGSIFGKQGRSFPHDPAHRGYHVVYRENEVNHCPGCGRSHWYVGRVSAECGFCGTALPLVDRLTTGAAHAGAVDRRRPASPGQGWRSAYKRLQFLQFVSKAAERPLHRTILDRRVPAGDRYPLAGIGASTYRRRLAGRSGRGGTGRRAGFRFQWATVGVRVPPPAPAPPLTSDKAALILN